MRPAPSTRRLPSSIGVQELGALLAGGALATVIGVLDDTFQLRARWQFLGQLVLAGLAIAAGISITSIANPFGPGSIVLEGPFAARVGQGNALAVSLDGRQIVVAGEPGAVVFSLDLSWLSPLLIFVGVVVFISRQNSGVGAFVNCG